MIFFLSCSRFQRVIVEERVVERHSRGWVLERIDAVDRRRGWFWLGASLRLSLGVELGHEADHVAELFVLQEVGLCVAVSTAATCTPRAGEIPMNLNPPRF